MIMKKGFVILAGIGAGLILSACSSQSVATINGSNITKDAYYQEMKESPSGQQALGQMILDKGLEKQYGNKVKNTAVTRQLNTVKKQYGASFSAFLTQNGLTASQYKRNLKEDLLLKAAIKANTKFTPGMLKQQFKHYQPKVTVNQILVSKKATAQKVIDQLNAGHSFAKLATAYSTDAATKKKSGRISPFDNTNTTLDPNFKKAAFKLKTGQYTKTPVKTQYGYEVIQMVNHPAKGTYQNHKEALKNQIVDTKAADNNTVHTVATKVLKRGKATVHDKQLQNVLAGFEKTSSPKA